MAQKSSSRTLFRLLREFTQFKKAIAVVVVLGIVVSAIQPLCVKVVQIAIDELKKEIHPSFFQWVPAALIGLFIVSGFAKYFRNLIRRTLCEKILMGYREQIFRKYLVLPLSYLDKSRAGVMLGSLQNDLQQINAGMDAFFDALKEPFTVLGLVGIAFYYDWGLTLATLILLPIVALLFSVTGAAVKRYTEKNLSQFSDLMAMSQEVLVGSRIVRVFQMERILGRKFQEVQERYFKTAVKSVRVQELSTPLVEFLGAIIVALVLIYGGVQISSGHMKVGELIGFLFAFGLIQMPIKQLNNFHLRIKAAEAAADRVFALLGQPEEIHMPFSAVSQEGFSDRVVFENVKLSYGEKQVLNSVSFEIQKGQCVALVGPSGGGKSSIASLLARLYEVGEGRILIDGKDTRQFSLSGLRSLMSYVTQEPFLFHDSIWENIRCGRPDASPEEILEAAKKAHCLEFINRVPKGFQALVGDRGMRLSGGERQRLAMARAILKNAPILILDEATSSLDSHSERMVQEALEELMEGCTTLLIAHRFSTLSKADKILVVSNGQIQKAGSHSFLMENSELYSKLYRQQNLDLLPTI